MSRKKVGLFAAGAIVLFATAAGLAADPDVAAGTNPVRTISPTPAATATATPTTTPEPGTTSPSASGLREVAGTTGIVVAVVDGDTIRVELPNGVERVRIIGIDTPETADPNRPPACFGEEASTFAKQALDGKTVTLEADPTQDARDRYDRLLAHVHVGGELYAAEAIAGGYGIHYIYDRPSIHAAELAAAEETARAGKLGIWSSCQGRVDLPLAAPIATTPPAVTPHTTKAAEGGCHPSYDPCVPDVDYDLDCADVGHPVRIVGPDEYRLDGRDKDGRGCEG